MTGVAELRMGLDRVAFAEAVTGGEPDHWQQRALRSESKRMLFNCCRQSGKSTTAGALALHRALYSPKSLILCLAPSLRQSQELFGKIAGGYRELGRPVPPQAERRLGLELENESRVITLPGSERTIRGFSGVDLLILDEAARVEDVLYHSVRPMLAVSGGSLIMLSTPHGRRGVFYDEWDRGEGWERYEVRATEVPRISPEFLEEERQALPDRVYRQEYLCSFEEAEGQVFDSESIETAFSDEDITPLFDSSIGGVA